MPFPFQPPSAPAASLTPPLPPRPRQVRTYYKELVQRTRRERRRGYHAAAGSGSPPPPPGTLKQARLQARLQAGQGSLEGELGTAVRWLGWGETSNVCEILLNAVKPRIPRALRGELSIRLGAPPLCIPRCDLSLGLSSPGHEGRPLYALSAFRHLNTNLAAHTAGRGGGGRGGGGGGGREGGGGETPPASPSHVTGHYTVRPISPCISLYLPTSPLHPRHCWPYTVRLQPRRDPTPALAPALAPTLLPAPAPCPYPCPYRPPLPVPLPLPYPYPYPYPSPGAPRAARRPGGGGGGERLLRQTALRPHRQRRRGRPGRRQPVEP